MYNNYNSGIGGPLNSIGKQIKFVLSVIFLVASIVFLTKAYYHDYSSQKKITAQELKKEFDEFENMIALNNLPKQSIIDKQIKIEALIQKLDKENPNEYDTYFSIIINIISAFLGWIIVFTFRNKILGYN